MHIPVIVSMIASPLMEKLQCGPASQKTNAISKHNPAWIVSVIDHMAGPLTGSHLGRNVQRLR